MSPAASLEEDGARRPTPAERMRARQDAAMAAPPKRITPRRGTTRRFVLRAEGREWDITGSVGAETSWEMTIDGAATLTLPVRSRDRRILAILHDEALMLRADGVTIELDGIVYALASVSSSEDGLYQLAFEDLVAWRLRQFDRFVSATRATTTRAGFVRRLIAEASRPPLAPMAWFIPELLDVQPVAASGSGSGSGS